ncbi:MAG: GrpB family protein [Victivallales bacterium]|nr:GrpB family protein [Victivallales bacterium]
MNEIAKPLSEMTLEELWQLFPIILSTYNPDWKNYYEEEKALLEKSFGDLLVRIEHIGSTAVEGLIAKPTVDILLETHSAASLEAVRLAAERCGYTVMSEKIAPEYRLDLCKGYTPQGFADKVFHLHIRHPGDWDEIVFRDFLRRNPAKAEEYAKLKTVLQKRFEHNRDAYTEAKGDFIRDCVNEARSKTRN